ncbi:MAG: GAF domain-containing protein [Mesorhizobium sp.]
MTDTLKPVTDFRSALEATNDPAVAWAALQQLADALFGVKLFTVSTVDMTAGLSRRLYTSDPASYPVSGTKPISRDAWYELVVAGRQNFIKNTLAEISGHFPDYELIGSLGCGSVLNMPVVLGGEVVGTVNCLGAEHHLTPERIAASEHLRLPALAAFLIFRNAGRG